jgi:hypothetical protein
MSRPIIDPSLPDIDRIAIAAKYESERRTQIKLAREIRRAATITTIRAFRQIGEHRVDYVRQKRLAPDKERMISLEKSTF